MTGPVTEMTSDWIWHVRKDPRLDLVSTSRTLKDLDRTQDLMDPDFTGRTWDLTWTCWMTQNMTSRMTRICLCWLDTWGGLVSHSWVRELIWTLLDECRTRPGLDGINWKLKPMHQIAPLFLSDMDSIPYRPQDLYPGLCHCGLIHLPVVLYWFHFCSEEQ